MTNQIALVVPDFRLEGGVNTVARFLCNLLRDTAGYECDLISLAVSSRDAASTQLTRPSTWGRGPIIQNRETESGVSFQHVGASLVELEGMRYRPRPILTRLLNQYDLIQVVAGTPPWAHVARNAAPPVALQAATLAAVERQGRHRNDSLPRRLWHQAMTHWATRLERSVPSFVEAVFVENQWMYEHFCDAMGEDRIHFAPPGTDVDRFHPANSEREGDYILSVGRMADPRKNVRLLFRAYHRLRQQCEDVPPLMLAGLSGPAERAMKTARELGIVDAIRIHEQVPSDQLPQLYRNARFFVLSSNEEGLGLVIAEAMASGLPVVSTDCGGPATLIEHEETGLLVPTRDPVALAQEMERLLKHPVLARTMGERGRSRVKNHFSVEATGRAFLRVYDQLLSESRPLA